MLKNKKIYIVIWDDCHSGTTAHPFEYLEDAIAWAKSKPKSMGVPDDRIREKPVDGRLYHIAYDYEGDALWVTEREIR